VKFGFIPTEGGHFYPEALTEVERGEMLGFDSVWMEEHHGVRDHYWPSPLVVLAGFATRTSRALLGTDIVVLPFYDPVRVAEDGALLDVISGGRFVFGVAIGYKPDEFALYRTPLEGRGGRFVEALTLIRALWTQETVTHPGPTTRSTRRGSSPSPSRSRIRRSGSAGGVRSPSGALPGSPTPGCRARPRTSRSCSMPSEATSASWRQPVDRCLTSGR